MKAQWKDYPPIPWVFRCVESPPWWNDDICRWEAGACWREYYVSRYGNTPEQAILSALIGVVVYRLAGNGFFLD
mgnify:CR=1 FL=1